MISSFVSSSPTPIANGSLPLLPLLCAQWVWHHWRDRERRSGRHKGRRHLSVATFCERGTCDRGSDQPPAAGRTTGDVKNGMPRPLFVLFCKPPPSLPFFRGVAGQKGRRRRWVRGSGAILAAPTVMLGPRGLFRQWCTWYRARLFCRRCSTGGMHGGLRLCARHGCAGCGLVRSARLHGGACRECSAGGCWVDRACMKGASGCSGCDRPSSSVFFCFMPQYECPNALDDFFLLDFCYACYVPCLMYAMFDFFS